MSEQTRGEERAPPERVRRALLVANTRLSWRYVRQHARLLHGDPRVKLAVTAAPDNYGAGVEAELGSSGYPIVRLREAVTYPWDLALFGTHGSDVFFGRTATRVHVPHGIGAGKPVAGEDFTYGPRWSLWRGRPKPIATDVQAVESIDDPHNAQFMGAATVLACSHEKLLAAPAEWAHAVLDRYPQCQTVLVGMGAEGCLLAARDRLACHIPAVTPGPVINTAGAGDALLAAYLHATHTAGYDPVGAAERAVLFAGHTVTAPGERYLSAAELDGLHAGIAPELHLTPPDTKGGAYGPQ